MTDSTLFHYMGLPYFKDVTQFSNLVCVPEDFVKSVTCSPDKYYKKFTIPKKNGGKRLIYAPSQELKVVQAWIKENILSRIHPSPYAMAYIRGKNVRVAMELHRSSRYFLCLDLKDFFPSISFERVCGVFETVGYTPNVSHKILGKICTFRGFLPQGAVTSPSLSNIVTLELDLRIARYTSQQYLKYTRYADDIFISGNNPDVILRVVGKIKKIIQDEHFNENSSKTRILSPKNHCQMLGLVKNASEPKFSVGRKKKREMRALIHKAFTKEEYFDKYHTLESLRGWIQYLKGVDIQSYDQMNKYWNKLQEKYPKQ